MRIRITNNGLLIQLFNRVNYSFNWYKTIKKCNKSLSKYRFFFQYFPDIGQNTSEHWIQTLMTWGNFEWMLFTIILHFLFKSSISKRCYADSFNITKFLKKKLLSTEQRNIITKRTFFFSFIVIFSWKRQLIYKKSHKKYKK